jgi:peptidoglycan hydrolase-like protein with peptidoglycan-binding domain
MAVTYVPIDGEEVSKETRTVRGEEWHLEADAKQLANYYKKHSGPGDPVIRPYYSKRFRGNSKPSVVRLQTLLRGAGLKGVPLNGKYDRDTRAAVGRFQHRHGMKVDRTVGAATWKALRKAQG